MSRRVGDADAGAEVQPRALEHRPAAESGSKSPRDRAPRGRSAPRAEDGELVAAEAGHRVAGAQRARSRSRDRRAVAGGVAEPSR